MEQFRVTGRPWIWRSDRSPASGWHFLTIDGQTAMEIRYATLGRTRGFGSVKVTAKIGSTIWNTSLFPDSKSGGFILPLKASVRACEGITTDADVTVTLEV